MAQLKPASLRLSFALFIIPTLLLIVTTQAVMPWMEKQLGIANVLTWFLAGGILVFIPIFAASIIAFKAENKVQTVEAFCHRMRMHPMNREDWKWVGIGLLSAGLGSFFLLLIFTQLSNRVPGFHPLSTEAPFLHFHGFGPGKEWMLVYWVPFFFFNIFGEELWWRGYILPRQELHHGRYAWLVNGLFWTIFHISFGLDLMILLSPLMLIEPWIVQHRKNTWIGIWMHALFNGPIFIALALNWI